MHLLHTKGHVVFEGQLTTRPHLPDGAQHKGARIDAAQRKDEHGQQRGHAIIGTLQLHSLRIPLLLGQLANAPDEGGDLDATAPHAAHLEERRQAAGQRAEGIHGIHRAGAHVMPTEAELRLAAVRQIRKVKDQPQRGPQGGRPLEA